MDSPTDDRAPRWALVIPVWNRPQTLMATIASIERQRAHAHCPGSVIVVDDGSEPPVELPAELASVVRIAHAGVSAARNAGVAAAAEAGATMVGFLDSDDELLDGWLESMTAAVTSGAELWSCAASYHWNDGSMETPGPSAMWRGAPPAPKALFLAGTFALSVDLFRAAGGYTRGVRYGENTDLGLRVGWEMRHRQRRWVVDERPLLRVNGVRKPFDPEVRLESARVLLSSPSAALRADRRLHASYLAIAGVSASKLGMTSVSRRYLWGAVRTEPWRLKHALRLVRALLPHGARP